MKTFKIIFSMMALLLATRCNLIEKQVSQNSIPSSSVFATPQGARAALLGCYDALQSGNYYGTRYNFFPDMQGGNLTWTGTFPSFGEIQNRVIQTNNAEVTNMWIQIYYAINNANQVIDKVAKMTDPSFTDQASVLGEAYFLRAFNYFNLVRYWGDVPLKTEPTDNFSTALQQPRAPVADVYTQILSDLGFAIVNIGPNSGARATVAAAHALKARVHLYRSRTGIATEWTDAYNEAVLAGTGKTLAANFSDLFVARNTNEVIWYLDFNTVDQGSMAFFLLPSASGGRNEMRPSAGLQSAFAANDTRRIPTNAVTGNLKYYRVTTGDDYALMFRLGEMILTEAEALIQRNTGTDLTSAVTLINQIRNRAGIGSYSGAVTQTALNDEVFLQRRFELALEGHYFFDIVTTGRAATLLSNPVWNDNQALFPIPLRETQANPNLAQNPGY